MSSVSWRWWLATMSLLAVQSCVAEQQSSLPSKVWKQARRVANLSSVLGSPKRTAKTPYDRIMSHPVFQVTTAWGAPYMNFEKVDRDELTSSSTGSKDIMGAEAESRPVTLFYMDPDDAIQMHQEMKQMGNMAGADIRITATTLAKAIRQSANFGNGLVTGAPVDPMNGKLKSMTEGGSLRYKIVPPKRQLFYAARCQGKERVGLFGTPAEEAETFVEGSDYVYNINLERRRLASERKSNKGRTAAQMTNAHMEGYTGIPVFYAPQLKKVLPKVKQLTSGNHEEIPFFFSYEDLMDAWSTMKKRNAKSAANIPDVPTNVQVYNLMDVLTSMERDEWAQRTIKKLHWKDPIGSLQRQFRSRKGPGLESVTFIPPSHCVQYKEKISAKGNGKARLRPMR